MLTLNYNAIAPSSCINRLLNDIIFITVEQREVYRKGPQILSGSFCEMAVFHYGLSNVRLSSRNARFDREI